MQCSRCGMPIPFGAPICNHCNSITKHKELESPIPETDMYGNKVIAFTPDENKSQAREFYLNNSMVFNDIYDVRIMNLHKRKEFYYVNKNVIGFALLTKIVTTPREDKRYYTVHEVDRRNIKSISYDSKFGEYVLSLYKPVYVDYSLPPTMEFRIQDIFDDSKLSLVLKHDLPPKYMMF